MVSIQSLESLGSGTYGSVHKVSISCSNAKLLDTNRVYACKIMKKDQMETTVWHHILCKELFTMEGERVGPQLHAVLHSTTKDSVLLLMDLYSTSFTQVLQLVTKVAAYQDVKQQVVWIRDVLLQLSRLHGRGIAHRDLKDGNILLRQADARACICDLGMTLGPLQSKSTSTRVCTLTYRAPEVLQGKTHDTAMDIWAVAMLMRNMQTKSMSLGSWHDTDIPEETQPFCNDVYDEVRERCDYTDTTMLSVWLARHNLGSVSLGAAEVLLNLHIDPAKRKPAHELLDSVVFRWDQPRYRERPGVLASALQSKPTPKTGTLHCALPQGLYPVHFTTGAGNLCSGILRTRPSKIMEMARRETIFYAFYRYYKSYGPLNFQTMVWTIDIFDRLHHESAHETLGHFYQQELLSLSLYLVQLFSKDVGEVTRLEELRSIFTPSAQTEEEKQHMRSLFFKALHTLQYRLTEASLSTMTILRRRGLDKDKTVQGQVLRAYVYWPDGIRSREEFVDSALVVSHPVGKEWDTALQSIV